MSSYFTLRKLTEPTGRDIASTFDRMAELLAGAEETARVQFRIPDGEAESFWSVEAGGKKPRAAPERTERPDFELITTADTWWEIAQGSLAPLRAFVQGRLRVRGDIDLGTRVLQRLAGAEPPPAQSMEVPWQ